MAVLAALMIAPAAAGVTFATSCPDTIAKGDTVTITGTGAANGSVAVMVMGRQYFHTFTAYPDLEGDFTAIMKPEETRHFQSGQYAFVILDPGANGLHEIGSRVTENGNISVTDKGVTVVDLGPVKDLRASVHPAVATLLAASGRAGVDDIVTPTYFYVEEPVIHFDQNADAETHRLILGRNDPHRLHFSGTTNMGVEDILTATIRSTASGDLVLSATLPAIVAGGAYEPGRNSGLNYWKYDMDTTGITPGEYFITVGWQKEKTTGTGTELFIVPDTAAMSWLSGFF